MRNQKCRSFTSLEKGRSARQRRAGIKASRFDRMENGAARKIVKAVKGA
jgi:hypothetical protein